MDRCLVSFVPVPFIGSSGGGIAQVVHRSAVEQVVTLTAGVTAVPPAVKVTNERVQVRLARVHRWVRSRSVRVHR